GELLPQEGGNDIGTTLHHQTADATLPQHLQGHVQTHPPFGIATQGDDLQSLIPLGVSLTTAQHPAALLRQVAQSGSGGNGQVTVQKKGLGIWAGPLAYREPGIVSQAGAHANQKAIVQAAKLMRQAGGFSFTLW